MWSAGVCLAILSLLAFCDTAAARPPLRGVWIKSGPPAHAPAHGYRRKQVCGFELVFDVGLGVYVAVGVTDVYYHEGYFYRLHGGLWEISLRAVTWEPAGIDRLPPGLQIKAKSMIKLNGNGNSLVKLNGNTGKPNGAADANINKPAANPDANKSHVNPDNSAGKPSVAADANVAKANGTADAGVNKPAGNADASAAKPNASPGSSTAGSVSKPSGTAAGSANKPAVKPDANRKTKPAGKGKKK